VQNILHIEQRMENKKKKIKNKKTAVILHTEIMEKT
jgi:hypothetical protein